MPRTVFSTSEEYFPAARSELLLAFPEANIERLGPDAGCLDSDNVGIADIARACRDIPIIFVRHLMQELMRLPAAEVADDIDRVYEAVLELLGGNDVGPEPALQVWVSGDSPLNYRTDDLWKRVADSLREQGISVARGNREQILSILVTPETLLLGINRREDALTDWPGGRVSLAKPRDQVSRSEFKLEELFKTFDIPLPSGGTALDLGASPGGWTRILRQRGLRVRAVDPAPLDRRIGKDPDVREVRTTAGRFLAETDLIFDLVVNDMRMTVTRSCEIMLEAAKRLKPNGLAILTLKISPHEPLKTVRASLRLLEHTYEILHVRQLFHNRNEVTVVMRRNSGM